MVRLSMSSSEATDAYLYVPSAPRRLIGLHCTIVDWHAVVRSYGVVYLGGVGHKTIQCVFNPICDFTSLTYDSQYGIAPSW